MGEANMCGVNHLDADARLPPRKRLLAGLKKQNCDLPSSSSSSLSTLSSDFNKRFHDLMSSNSKGSRLSLEEIVDASRTAATAAAKFAAAAKIAAEQKATVAAKAMATAKSALELVASSEKGPLKLRCMRKNKPKKHVPVKLLYGRHNLVGNCETDEEVARKLHQAMNSSPRISKNSTSSGRKIHNHKKHRKLLTSEKFRDSNEGVVWKGSPSSTCDRTSEAEDTVKGKNLSKLVEKSSECTKTNCSYMDGLLADGEAEASNLKVRALEDTIAHGGKRGRTKQKKLSLSLCTIRDCGNSKEESERRGFPLVEEPKGKSTATNVPLFPEEASIEGVVSVEAVSTRKFKEFNAPQCYTGSGVLYSLCSNPAVTTGVCHGKS